MTDIEKRLEALEAKERHLTHVVGLVVMQLIVLGPACKAQGEAIAKLAELLKSMSVAPPPSKN